jgi:hypothetical protein
MSYLLSHDSADVDAQDVARRYGPTVVFWLSVALVLVGGWLYPHHPDRDQLVTNHVAISLSWFVGLAIVLCGFVIAEGLIRRQHRLHLLRTRPAGLLATQPLWPGLTIGCCAVGIVVALLGCWQFVQPRELGAGGYRAQPAITALAGLATSAAIFTLVNRSWNRGAADVAAGLLAVGVCGLVLCALPGQPAELSARFPLIFNVLVVALAVLTLFWNWIHGVWAQQLDHGAAWTTAGRLHALTGRFAFTCAVIAVMLAVLMSIWVRLPITPYRDVSFGRVTFGVAGHLLLILSLLWSQRRWRRSSFTVLAILAVMSLVGFVVVRVSDFVTVSL